MGIVKVIELRYASDYPKSLSAHDIGLKDLVESAAVLGNAPKVYLIIEAIQPNQDLTIELSSNIKQSIPKVIKYTKQIIQKINHH